MGRKSDQNQLSQDDKSLVQVSIPMWSVPLVDASQSAPKPFLIWMVLQILVVPHQFPLQSHYRTEGCTLQLYSLRRTPWVSALHRRGQLSHLHLVSALLGSQ
jgi:hypothetical protein